MKPREILKKYKLIKLINNKDKDYNPYWSYSSFAQARTINTMSNYLDEDCVIAYLTENIGFCFIIKSKKSYFGFYGVQSDMYFGGFGYVYKRCNLKEAVKLIDDGGKIIDKKEYDKVKDTILLNNLSK